MSKSLDLYNEIGNDLIRKNKSVTLSQMFGMPTLKVNSKAFSGLIQNEMVFKLGGEDHTRALALKGSKLFDPGGMNRPMKEWVVIPAKFSDQWKSFAEAAMNYVETGARIKSKPVKGAVRKK